MLILLDYQVLVRLVKDFKRHLQILLQRLALNWLQLWVYFLEYKAIFDW